MNTNTHHNQQRVFSQQSDTAIEQILPSSGHVPAVQRTESRGDTRLTRESTLDADRTGISRIQARQTARPTGEWGRGRPTQTYSSQSNTHRATHKAQAATLVHFAFRTQSESRTATKHPGNGTKQQTSGYTNTGQTPLDPDKSQKAFTHAKRPPRAVRQDKGVLTNDRVASSQPASLRNGLRSHRTPTENVCSQTKFVHKHTTVPLPLHVDPLLKAEIQRIAEVEGLSVSQVGATALGEWVHQRLHDHHEALLYPVLRQLIRDELRAFGNRIIFFLMRIAYAAEQARILITNVLHKICMQMGLPNDKFNELLDKSSRMARRNIIAGSPQIKSLMEEWKQSSTDQENNHETKRNEKP